MTRLLIVGGGGHAKVAIEAARAAGFEPVGVIDPSPAEPTLLGIPVLGGDDKMPRLFTEGFGAAFVALGSNRLRRKINHQLRSIGFDLPTIIHPGAIVSPSALVGEGVLVMPGAIINASAVIKDFVIVNTGAIVEHDCQIGEAAHIAPGSVMGGSCWIGEEVLFGIGAAARPMSRIGDRAVVGAGAVVACSIDVDAKVGGVPARPLRLPLGGNP